MSDAYPLMFAFPSLESLKVTLADWFCLNSLSIATTDEHSSTLKFVILDHRCTFSQLAILLSYTPALNHLEFEHERVRDSDIEALESVTLPNLTHLSIDVNISNYDEFEPARIV